MELREFQKKVTHQLADYLVALDKQRAAHLAVLKDYPEIAQQFDFAEKAWSHDMKFGGYTPSRAGDGRVLPSTCLKVPTGGGKTLLACHAIDLVNKNYLKQQTGLALWIVPTTQIYRQTLRHLRDREHPYRQFLDLSSAGRTRVLEKTDRFTPADVEGNLCVLLLMLQSSARVSKEQLKVFQDSGAHAGFFPAESDYKRNAELIDQVPNLDTFSASDMIGVPMPKTSLGNVLRILRPLTIVDEGHKAYSETARETIAGFNPSFVLELSATPTRQANVLASVSGHELNDEEMIKLDVNVTNKHSSGWKETVAAGVARRATLEKAARRYEQNTSVHIRPVMLVQVERTGKEQRDGKLVHAEDVREYLIDQHSIPIDQIAVKSSSTDEIEGIDLLDPGCPIRFIITKQALQEGWDCPFAYVLCALGSSKSETAMTQLIGRVLRQPYARKTKVKALDECYVFAHQQDTAKLIGGIKRNLESEGLADLASHIRGDAEFAPEKTISYRKKFKDFAGRIYLPLFATIEQDRWRELLYEVDLLSRVDWSKADLNPVIRTHIDTYTVDDDLVRVGVSADGIDHSSTKTVEYESDVNVDDITRQIVDIVPNPWVAHEMAEVVCRGLLENNDKEVIASNIVAIANELRKHLKVERDRLCRELFQSLLESGEVRFVVLQGDAHSMIPKSVRIRTKRQLNHHDGSQVQLSLLEQVPEEGINDLERDVALYLDRQERLLFWYRNLSGADYRIQGWQKGRVYPDFVAAGKKSAKLYDKLFVFETKGAHLSGNPDTEYKRELLDLCTQQSAESNWAEFAKGLTTDDCEFIFSMVDEKSWQSTLGQLING